MKPLISLGGTGATRTNYLYFLMQFSHMAINKQKNPHIQTSQTATPLYQSIKFEYSNDYDKIRYPHYARKLSEIQKRITKSPKFHMVGEHEILNPSLLYKCKR